MAETVEKFLKKYFKQLHFNSMPVNVRSHFFEWVKNDTLTADMRLWVRDYLEHQPAPNEDKLLVVNGKYVPKRLPDPNDNNALPEEEARELFIQFQNAFAKMDSAKNSFKDKDPQSLAFLQQYFGPGKLFKTSKARDSGDHPTCKEGINAIINLLKTNEDLRDYITENTKDDEGKALFKTSEKLKTDLFDKCDAGEYDTNASVQGKLQKVAKTLASIVGFYSSMDSDSPEYQAVKRIEKEIKAVLASDAFTIDAANIPSTDLGNFRNIFLKSTYTDPDHPGLLQTLYFNKNVRDRFAKYDDGVITSPIEKAESEVNWQDKSKDNYVAPKIKDTLTPLQQIQKWTSDTYNDSLKKYEELRGGTVFKRKEAKDIFNAIDSAKISDTKKGIKPSDGLDGLLKNKDAIEKKIDNPEAKQHFKWFVETMEPLEKPMEKAIAGAWNNAEQMKAVITEIILKATDPRNTDPEAIHKAETAMEIMTAMKYGMLTSKVMDALKQTEFSMFSDGKLSWNKNEGIQFVTRAFDKSVKAAFLGVGYSITFARNAIMMRNMKFTNSVNTNKNSPLAARYKEEQDNMKQALRNQNAADTSTLNDAENERNTLGSAVIRHQARTANFQQIMNRQQGIKQANEAQYNSYNASKQILDKKKELEDSVTDLTPRVAAAQAEFANPATYTDMPDLVRQEKEKELYLKWKELEQQLDAAQNQLMTNGAQYHDAEIDVLNNQAAHDAYENADKTYNKAQQHMELLNSKVTRFNEANQTIRELNTAINERNNALANWPEHNTSRMLELENYWNWLQTGDVKTWGLSQKKAQDAFDAKDNTTGLRLSDELFQKYKRQYGLAS